MVKVQDMKRIMISLPDHLLREIDQVVAEEKTERRDLVQKAIKDYLIRRNKQSIQDNMENGYLEMARINLFMASEAFFAEEDADCTLGRSVSGV